VQHSAYWVVRHDRRHSRSLGELITEPRPKLRVFDLLKSQPNRLAKNLSDALLACALGAVIRYSVAELRQHRLEGFFVFRPHRRASMVSPSCRVKQVWPSSLMITI